jgi:hypothetical protein
MRNPRAIGLIARVVLIASTLLPSGRAATVSNLLTGRFSWKTGPPVIAPANRTNDPCRAIKDPSAVFHQGRWHVFATIRSKLRTHQIEYLSFADWKEAERAERHVLQLTDGYFCAPQVFYFTPHRKWYLIYQVNEPTRKPSLQPAFSTSTKIEDPGSWTKPALIFAAHPSVVRMWIDFWVICDDSRAHLFFTSLDGRMWRAETKLVDFPSGWGEPRVVLKDAIFEASHTYRLLGQNRFLTLIEAQRPGGRYYKAYLAETLDGQWKPLAVTLDNAFAAPSNVRETGSHWTDSFSHGELLRAGIDEHLEVDPGHLRFLFQGATDGQLTGKAYGEIPWRLGLLEPVNAN